MRASSSFGTEHYISDFVSTYQNINYTININNNNNNKLLIII